MKICNICKIEKQFTEFHKHKFQKDGYNTICKECRKPITKKYVEDNREEISKKRSQRYYENHQENLIKDRERIKKEREKRKERTKRWMKENPEKRKEYIKKYNNENKEKLLKKRKEYYKKNKEKILKRTKERFSQRKKEDIFFKLKTKLRTDIYISLKRKKRNKRLEEILGTSINGLKHYIESQFESWMTWENWGKTTWHIDHIVPLSSAKDEQSLFELWHYTNLRPLSAIENLKKGKKIILENINK